MPSDLMVTIHQATNSTIWRLVATVSRRVAVSGKSEDGLSV